MNESRHRTVITPFTKINLKWIRGLNIKHETITLLGDNIEELDHLGKWLPPYSTKGTIHEINDMLDFIEIKHFCSAKDTEKKMKRWGTDCEKLQIYPVTFKTQ